MDGSDSFNQDQHPSTTDWRQVIRSLRSELAAAQISPENSIPKLINYLKWSELEREGFQDTIAQHLELIKKLKEKIEELKTSTTRTSTAQQQVINDQDETMERAIIAIEAFKQREIVLNAELAAYTACTYSHNISRRLWLGSIFSLIHWSPVYCNKNTDTFQLAFDLHNHQSRTRAQQLAAAARHCSIKIYN